MEGFLPPTSDSTLSNRELFGLVPVMLLVFVLFLRITCMIYKIGQKTRDPQPRRVYVGSRERPSIGQQPPTIYVSPANLPPPPKYEAMDPPSYEEVVGVHYPQYQPPINSSIQPITQPLTTAVAAHYSQTAVTAPDVISNSTNPSIPTNAAVTSTVVTVTAEERRVQVASSVRV